MIFYKGRLPWLPASDSKRKPRKGGGVSVIQKDAPTVFSPQRAAASLSLDGQEGEEGHHAECGRPRMREEGRRAALSLFLLPKGKATKKGKGEGRTFPSHRRPRAKGSPEGQRDGFGRGMFSPVGGFRIQGKIALCKCALRKSHRTPSRKNCRKIPFVVR